MQFAQYTVKPLYKGHTELRTVFAVYKSTSELGTSLYTGQPAGSPLVSTIERFYCMQKKIGHTSGQSVLYPLLLHLTSASFSIKRWYLAKIPFCRDTSRLQMFRCNRSTGEAWVGVGWAGSQGAKRIVQSQPLNLSTSPLPTFRPI